ncbi:3',5'-cyclic adenosine monophosphate phosphodiesterase CpdA [Arenibacter antarcticus]|uniref:Calcineurin-like phosphoesterase C-terminal domain-containing protein n=1 Tax=Arenibacter antarcticus TaxID=2040469 RepID=A0ABW5VLV9_9FLAO|nr:calcineurin-like phosphoesterase family protein [Arenibacter sp. H213]MCM4166764.1 phosphoesterase [Arenibacter sp. H213]
MATQLRILIVLILGPLLLIEGVFAQDEPQMVQGKVFLDRNQNNILDSKEQGLKKVWVSNGDTIVQTDKKGNYRIRAKKGQTIFPIIPSKYTYTNKNNWWHIMPDSWTKEISYDFGLIKQEIKRKFKFLAIGDIQVGDTTELLQASNSILKELTNRNDYDFSIYLGDLVNDSPNLFKPLNRIIQEADNQAWTVYGNHDRNFNAERTEQSNLYNINFGPNTYAFFRNKVLFISLNSIYPIGKYGYEGIYGKEQLRFLESLVQKVPKDHPIVINQHIPFVGMKNKDEVLNILNEYHKVLFLTGHTHTVFQNYIKTPAGNTIHELTAGAVSGYWWTGQKSWEGIPLALMNCGTPRGYFEIDFDKESYTIKYKGVGLPKEQQLSVWAGEYNGEPSSFLSESNEFYVNIFSGSDRTSVAMKFQQAPIQYLEKVTEMDPFVAYIRRSQKDQKSPDGQSKSSPYLKKHSRHLWKGKLPKNTVPGIYKVEILVQDPKLKDFHQSIWIWKK